MRVAVRWLRFVSSLLVLVGLLTQAVRALDGVVGSLPDASSVENAEGGDPRVRVQVAPWPVLGPLEEAAQARPPGGFEFPRRYFPRPADMVSGGGGTPTFVQESAYSVIGYYTGGASISSAFGSANAAGNLIVVGVSLDYGAGLPTVTDSRSNTYVLLQDRHYGTSPGDATLLVYYAKNIASGSNTILVSAAGGAFNGYLPIVLHALEFSGCSTTTPIPSSSSSDDVLAGSQVNMTSGTFTDVASSTDLAWAKAKNIYNDSWGNGTGATTLGTPTTNARWTSRASVGGSTSMGGTTGWNDWQMAGFALQ